MTNSVRPKDDYYPTPEFVTKALLKHIQIPDNVYLWEPSCGDGAISKLLPTGRTLSTDLVQRSYGTGNIDFLKVEKAPFGDNPFWIITNPPFGIADEYVRKAFSLGAEKIILLLRYNYCEGARRSDIIDGGRLERVLLFKERITMFPGYFTEEEKKKRGTCMYPHAWFIFNKNKVNNEGEFVVKRISRKDGINENL